MEIIGAQGALPLEPRPAGGPGRSLGCHPAGLKPHIIKTAKASKAATRPRQCSRTNRITQVQLPDRLSSSRVARLAF